MSKKEIKTRDVREEMITDDQDGPLYIDEKYKEQGYVYRIVDSTRPGRVATLIRKGYEVVHKEGTQVGDNTVSASDSLTSAVTIELGTLKSTLGILMRIPEDKYARRLEMKRKKAQEQAAQVGQSGVPTQFGEVIIGN